MLSPYRVVDLSDERGLLCGQILADLGADVIQVEPPGGSSARRLGPFAKDEASPEGSLFWWAYTRNKRSVVLDLESDAGREQARALAAGADFWIESDTPGRMDELGLGYEDLRRDNPALVYVSISPFGQTGPKARWPATDLTLSAAGGLAYLSGEPERPPVRVAIPQLHAFAAADAAAGALLAHVERRRSGLGQHVDVSSQDSATLATMFRALDAAVEQVPARRTTGGVQIGAAFLHGRYPVRDGYVILGPGFLPSTGHFMVRLLEWAGSEGYDVAGLLQENWGSFARRLVMGELGADAYDATDAVLRPFLAGKTKAELMEAAVERKLLLAPVLDIDEVIDSEQIAERGFAIPVARPDGAGTARFPGPFARFAAAPLDLERPPPRLDEHGEAVRGESGRIPASAGPSASSERRRPLEGVKILDLFWVLAGPAATRMLADYGATVVRVESIRRLDTLRVIQPFQFSHPHPEGAAGFQSANVTKLGVTLDLTRPEGRDVALDLVRWADVVTESFAPGVIDEYGLGYQALRAISPEVIMISSCLMGQTGPWRDLTGFGNLAASVTSFQQLASWPGRPPSGPWGAYTDFIGARYNAIAILAALEHRERTGRGQHVDMSQAEAAFHFIAPALLDYTVNGRVPGPVGNADHELFPHDVYPAAGDDQWVAIAVRSDAEWRALCESIERPDLLDHRADRARVDEAIAAWTRAREASDVEAALIGRSIPAHVCLDTPGLFADPQLQHRGHYLEIAHEIYGTSWVESSRLRLSESQPTPPQRALHFGCDNRVVLEELLGYPPERIAQLAADGVLA